MCSGVSLGAVDRISPGSSRSHSPGSSHSTESYSRELARVSAIRVLVIYVFFRQSFNGTGTGPGTRTGTKLASIIMEAFKLQLDYLALNYLYKWYFLKSSLLWELFFLFFFRRVSCQQMTVMCQPQVCTNLHSMLPNPTRCNITNHLLLW